LGRIASRPYVESEAAVSQLAAFPAYARSPIASSGEHPSPLHQHTDAALILALQLSEDWAIETLHARYTPAMLGIALRYTENASVAEDIVQEAWIGVMRGIARFEGRCSLKTWIFRILHYRARSWRSKERQTVSFSLLRQSEHSSGSTDECMAARLLAAQQLQIAPLEEHALTSETGAAIRVAIDELPATQRAVVVLRDVAGWPAGDVCRHLQLSAGNQRVLLHRARRRLRQLLEGVRA
jgi:RNA polymerase sigma-70 factor (ECF subfamily)